MQATLSSQSDDDPWRALLHRWFVQYNPFYLVSAMLVLAGLNLVSHGLARAPYGPLAVEVLAELYVASLLAGTALLVRNGQQRPAVLLALLVVVYQADLTLHTETCAVLGLAGMLGSFTWVALFVAKLWLLGRALRVRLERRALLAASLGACALAIGPYVITVVDPRLRATLLALGLVLVAALVPRHGVELGGSSDAWSTTVARRMVRATWSIWAMLFAVHVAFWNATRPIAVLPALVGLGLWFGAKRLREPQLYAALVVTCGITVVCAHEWLAPLALVATAVLLVRACRPRAEVRPQTVPAPYRSPVTEPTLVQDALDPNEHLRLLSAALGFAYVGALTWGWYDYAELPAHRLWLDLSLLAASAALTWWRGARLVWLFVAGVGAQGAWSAGVVPVPVSALEWGASTLGLGFTLLFASLAISHRLGAPLAGPPLAGRIRGRRAAN